MNGCASPDAPLPETPTATSTFRNVNGVDLHVVTAGDESDPLVVLLHGFPEFWYEWREYVEPLVDAGYRVLVPDQRGYNLSDKPVSVRQYRISLLSGDIAELVASEGRESAHVVGHDWGAAVAWDLALRRPEVVDRLGIVNVPHPTVIAQQLRTNLTQLRKSWYVFYFQLPVLPEWTARRREFALLVGALDSARPGAFDETDFERYRAAWGRSGALTAMLNWYRAAVRHSERPSREDVAAETLLLWGEDDQALVPEMAPMSFEYCQEGRLETFPDATHWIVHERREEITELLLSHLDG